MVEEEIGALRGRVPFGWRTVGWATVYALAILVGRLTRVPPSELALAWPAAGAGLVWLLDANGIRRRAIATGILIAVTGAVNQATGAEAVAAWLFGVVNATHALVGVWILAALRWRTPRPMRSVGELGVLLVASIGASAASAVLGGLVAMARLDTPFDQGLWLIGMRNTFSTTVVTAGFLAVPVLATRWRQIVRSETLLLSGITVATTYVVMQLDSPLSYLIIPPLVLVAIRCGTAITSMVVVAQGTIVVAMTRYGIGPFSDIADLQTRVYVAQGKILVLAVVGLVVSLAEQDRSRALAASREDRNRLKDHMEAALVANAHLVLDSTGGLRTVEVNSALQALTGRGVEELLGSDPCGWLTAASADTFVGALTDLVAGRGSVGWRGELRFNRGHHDRWVDAALSGVWQGPEPRDHEELTLQMIDITAQKEAEERLAHLALHDELTGLPNRLLWNDRVEVALREAERTDYLVSVLYVDIDHFKEINDTYGHDVGDEVLREFARRLTHEVRPHDTVARLGGDEFVVLCPLLTTPDDGAAVAARIQEALRTPFQTGGRMLNVSASIGVASAETPSVDARAVMKRADTALYMAKRGGRGRFEIYEPAMHHSLERAARVLRDLDRALEENELIVHYQPIVDAPSRRVVALEALLRWNHPELGILTAGEFIDLIETSELVHRVGQLVLRRVCEDGVTLVASGHRLAMHVNVSARELTGPRLLEGVRETLRKTGFPPELLVLEITETRFVSVNASLVKDLMALRELGVRLAVDDFGTGYSALTHLVEMPIGIVKLDKSFVSEIGTSDRAYAVTSGVSAMSRGLGLRTVAEGVESTSQADALSSIGYHQLQGFLFGRPEPLEGIIEMLAGAPSAGSG